MAGRRGSPELILAAALRHGGSSAVAQPKEGCTGSPSRASPGHGWRHGDRAMAVKKWRWRRSVRVVLGHGGKRRRAGRGAVENGGPLPLYRGRGVGRRPVIKTKKWPVFKSPPRSSSSIGSCSSGTRKYFLSYDT
jgi:hypothetical protein